MPGSHSHCGLCREMASGLRLAHLDRPAASSPPTPCMHRAAPGTEVRVKVGRGPGRASLYPVHRRLLRVDSGGLCEPRDLRQRLHLLNGDKDAPLRAGVTSISTATSQDTEGRHGG